METDLRQGRNYVGTTFTYNAEFSPSASTDVMGQVLADLQARLKQSVYAVWINPENRYNLTCYRKTSEMLKTMSQTSRNETMAVYLNPKDDE